MSVLCELASYPGEVIPRYELIKRIWKVDYGADESLTRAISVLRKTFRKGGASEKYIETISKNGYRLIAPVMPWVDDGTRDVAQPRLQQSAPTPPTVSAEPQPTAPVAASPTPIAGVPAAALSVQQQSPRHMPSLPVSPAAAKPHMAQSSNKIVWAFGLSTLTLLFVIGAAIPFARGYFNANTDTYEQELAALGNGIADGTTNGPQEFDTVAIAQADNLGPTTANGQLVAPSSAYGRSVAVMSFADMSLASDQEYFSDGMAEELLTQLADITGLRIVGRQASFAYKDRKTDFRKIGRELRVSHIIDGSVRTHGDLVRVSVQLINTSDRSQIWSQSYDGMLTDGFALQERISRDIVAELTLVLDTELEDPILIDLGGPMDVNNTYQGENEPELITAEAEAKPETNPEAP